MYFLVDSIASKRADAAIEVRLTQEAIINRQSEALEKTVEARPKTSELSEFEPFEVDGKERVTLTLNEMSRHSHNVNWANKHTISLNNSTEDVPGNNQYRLDWAKEMGAAGDNMTTVPRGLDASHNNMPS